MRRKIFVLLLIITLLAPLTPLPTAESLSTVRVTAFTSPDSSYRVVTRVVARANRSIYMEMYSVSNRYLVDLISRVAERGVKVAVILQRRHVSHSENVYTLGAAHEWWVKGVGVRWATNRFAFTHSKFLVIDNSTLIVMSGNWAKTGVPVDPSYGNREWGIVVYSYPALARRFLDVFDRDYSEAVPYKPSDGEGQLSSYAYPRGSYPHPFTAKNFTVPVGENTFTPVFSPTDSEEKLLSLIDGARTSIYVEQLTFELRWGSSLSPLVTHILRRVEAGVAVRVVLNHYGSTDENLDTARYLASRGVAVRLSNTKYFATTHNKGMIVDHTTVLISSINWGYNSIHRNREAGLIVRYGPVARYFEEVFNWDWSVGSPVPQETTSTAEYPKIVINEVELNPQGSDSGREWVELFNPNSFPVNLQGWSLVNSRGVKRSLSGTIGAKSYYVYVSPTQWLRNTNEQVRLLDPSGKVVDETPILMDTENDDNTWQRYPNGEDTDKASDWVFAPSTRGRANGGETSTSSVATGSTTIHQTTGIHTTSTTEHRTATETKGGKPWYKDPKIVAVIIVVVLLVIVLIYLVARHRH